MNAFTIKDLENLSGIKAHTIRIWEQRYSFLRPQRSDTNIRYYSNDELKTLLNISLLNKYGFKISHIDKMSEKEMHDKIVSLHQVEAQLEKIVNDLIKHLVDLNLDQFEKIIDDYILSKGIEKSILQIIFPFLQRIGILWVTNHINPAQEHLVTNILRQKLIVGIDRLSNYTRKKTSALLFLPEGEHHELGLLFVYYLLKNNGIKVLYLGANVPLKDMEYIVKLKRPDFLYTHLTSVAHHFNLEKFIHNMHGKLPDFQLIVSGQLAQDYKKKSPANICLKKSLTEVNDYIASL